MPFISSTGGFPNFPRFRVDEDDKCDPTITSVFGDAVWYRQDLTTFPNPTRDWLTVALPEDVPSRGQLIVLDMEGRLVHEQVLSGDVGELQLDMSGYAEGVYSVEYFPEDNKERRVWTSRVVVVE